MGKTTRKITGLRLRGDVYYADTRANGIRISQRIGKVSESTAKAILSKLISDAFKNEYFPKNNIDDQLLRSILNDYGKKKLFFTKSFETRYYLLKPLDRLLGFKTASELRISDVEEYRRARLKERKKINGKEIDQLVSVSTVNHEVKELLIALQWAVRERLIEFNPIAGIEHLKEPDPEKIMLDDGDESGDEWRRLYNAIGERDRWRGRLTLRGKKDRLKFMIQYKTGMRIGEVNQIEYAWIDQIAMRIHIPADKTKSQKPRSIPIDMELVQAITEYRADIAKSPLLHDRYLFYNPKTGTHEKRSFRAFRNAVERAGLSPDITSHALRRTRGTIWDGIDERASMEVLGHSDKKVHRRHYTKVTEDRIDNLVGRADNKPSPKSKES
jgi:integrase